MSVYIRVELQRKIRDRFTEMKGLTAVGRATIAGLQMNRPALVRARAMWVKLDEHPPKLP